MAPVAAEHRAFRRQVRHGYAWNAFGMASQQVLTFAVSVVLARILSKSDFGLVALVNVFLNIAQNLDGLGLGNVVVYYRKNEDEYPTYSAVSALFGLAMAGFVCAIAPFAARFYSEPRLAPLLQVSSLSLALLGLRTVATASLSKRMDFRGMKLVEVGASFAGLAVTLVLALRGYGPWSLVASFLTSSGLTTAVYLWLVPPSYSLRHWRSAWRKIKQYGASATASNLLWRLYDQADFIIVGKLLNADILGAYNLAFNLATLVNSKLGGIVGAVTFPAFSVIQNDRDRVTEHWFSLLRGLALLCFPLLTCLCVESDDIIQVVYGTKWMAAAIPLRFLCVVGAFRSITPVTLALTAAQGRTDVNFRYAWLNFLILPVGFYIGCKTNGITGVAAAWCFLFPVTGLYLMRAACNQMSVSLSTVMRTLLPALITSAIAAIPMILLRPVAGPGFARLLLTAACGGACAAVTVLVRRDFRSALLNVVRSD